MTVKKQETAVTKSEPTQVARYIPMGTTKEIVLSAEIVKQFISVPTASGLKPSITDCIGFVLFCESMRANPFTKDVYMIGYDTNDGPQFNIIAGIDLFLKRAELNEAFHGYEAGIIVISKEFGYSEKPGTILLEDETLLGGWAKVYRSDRQYPFYKAVQLKTYDTGYSRWKKDPAGMISKVPLAQALKAAFPSAIGLSYLSEEMDTVVELEQPKAPISMPVALDAPKEPETKPEPTKTAKATLPPTEDPNFAEPKGESEPREEKPEPQSLKEDYPKNAKELREKIWDILTAKFGGHAAAMFLKNDYGFESTAAIPEDELQGIYDKVLEKHGQKNHGK